MHGARPQETILRGEQHPNFKHGRATKKKRNQEAASATKLLLLRDLGQKLGMFGDQPTGWAGRPPNIYCAAEELSIEELIQQIELLDNEVLFRED